MYAEYTKNSKIEKGTQQNQKQGKGKETLQKEVCTLKKGGELQELKIDQLQVMTIIGERQDRSIWILQSKGIWANYS